MTKRRRVAITAFALVCVLTACAAAIAFFDISYSEIEQYEARFVSFMLRPTYFLLGVVHVVIALISVTNRPRYGHEWALIRFIASKSVLWFYLAFTEARDITVVFVILVLLMVTANELMIRYIARYGFGWGMKTPRGVRQVRYNRRVRR